MSTSYDWLMAHRGAIMYPVTTYIDYGDGGATNTYWARAMDWSVATPSIFALMSGSQPEATSSQQLWFFQSVPGTSLSYDAWAIGKAMQQWQNGLNPDAYDWTIIGEYNTPVHRSFIFDLLKQAAQAAGMPTDYDWTRCLAVAARQHWEQTGQPFRYLETPALAPIYGALACAVAEYPALQPYVDQIAPGSELWAQSVAEANARRDAHHDISNSLTTMFVLGALSFGAAAYFAPAAAAGTVSATGTATVSGAELAALVEAGTVGAEGAFLEAAALTGSAVTYSTGSGALLNAVTPAGEVLAFDANLDAFAQFNIEPSQMVIEAPSDFQLPDTSEIPNVEPSPDQGLIEQATDAAASLAEQQAKALVAQQIQEALQDDPGMTPLAPPPKKADIVPLLALGIVGGAIALRQMRKQ